jgi:hypothetical protein
MAASDLAQLAPIMLHYHNGIDETSDDWPILLLGEFCEVIRRILLTVQAGRDLLQLWKRGLRQCCP